ncbi:MAG: hypothetical protein JXA66_02250 [Oligoflexia bacterium]|nr:hypothetical protein [Oligoflexia bacterium]
MILLIIFSIGVAFPESAHNVDWQDLIFTPSVLPEKEVTGTTEEKGAVDTSLIYKAPVWALSVNAGVLLPPPVRKFKAQYPLGMGFSSLRGYDWQFMAVFPARLRISFGYLVYCRNPLVYRSNIGLYAGLAVQSTGGDFMASVFTIKNYAPSVGIRSYIRRKQHFSGLVVDNRYEFIFDGTGHLRILLTAGYFVPL